MCLKKLIVIVVSLLLTSHLAGQVRFEPGYFVDNSGVKTECLIRNYDWKNSPDQLEYKLLDVQDAQIRKIGEVKEFGVSNTKYVRFTVEIDQSVDALVNISSNKDPEFKEETLFLTCLVEGCASLYQSPAHKKFFMKVDSTEIVQLISKKYLLDNRVASNNAYKSQLYSNLSCSMITLEDCRNTRYTKSDLIKIINKYNDCKECSSITYQRIKSNETFNIKIKPGLRTSTLSKKNSENTTDNVDFGWNTKFCLGLEAEFVFPFNKNKWTFVIEPTYQAYNAKDPRPYHTNVVNYQSLEIPVGLRYYMFLGDQSKLFLSTSFVVFDLPFNSNLGALEINSTRNFILGFGYNFHNRISGELRYSLPRGLLNRYVFYSTSYQSITFTLGVSIFRR